MQKPMANLVEQARERSHAVRVGVVGLGYWGPNLVRVLHELPEASLLSVCDVQQDALAGVNRRYPGLRTTRNYEELLDDPELEAIAIATPVSTHSELARLALEAGKHVFVEKPLTDSIERATAL